MSERRAAPAPESVYRGKIAAGQIARETGFKEGQAIRVFPFGYVAHPAAADGASLQPVGLYAGARRAREREVAPRAAPPRAPEDDYITAIALD